MNPKRLVLAIVAVFIGVFLTDYLIHEVLLKSSYAATPSLWRPKAEMEQHFPWLLAAQLLASSTAVVLWARGFAEKATFKCAVLFGLFMALFGQSMSLVLHAVQPFPLSLALKWIVSGAAQGVLMGVIAFLVYKPATAAQSNA